MKTRVLVALFVASAAGPALAQSTSLTGLANDLGTVLAAEQLCELSYNPVAISAFIEEQVPADDMGFAGRLQMMTRGGGYTLEDMSASSRTAHCTQIERVARSFGFIE